MSMPIQNPGESAGGTMKSIIRNSGGPIGIHHENLEGSNTFFDMIQNKTLSALLDEDIKENPPDKGPYRLVTNRERLLFYNDEQQKRKRISGEEEMSEKRPTRTGFSDSRIREFRFQPWDFGDITPVKEYNPIEQGGSRTPSEHVEVPGPEESDLSNYVGRLLSRQINIFKKIQEKIRNEGRINFTDLTEPTTAENDIGYHEHMFIQIKETMIHQFPYHPGFAECADKIARVNLLRALIQIEIQHVGKLYNFLKEKSNQPMHGSKRPLKLLINPGRVIKPDIHHISFMKFLGTYLRKLLVNEQHKDHTTGIVNTIEMVEEDAKSESARVASTTSNFPSMHSLYAALNY